MDTTTEITAGCRNCPGETGWGRKEESACGARNLMPPFPGPRVYGTDPRRQGCVAGEILQKQEHFCSHRVAPLTAPVPFRKTRCTTAERGPIQRRRTPAGAGLDVWPKSGQQGTGAPAPATPHAKKSKLSLDGRRPSHGSHDRKGVGCYELRLAPSWCRAVIHGTEDAPRVVHRVASKRNSAPPAPRPQTLRTLCKAC
jgi:hypothetical protein